MTTQLTKILVHPDFTLQKIDFFRDQDGHITVNETKLPYVLDATMPTDPIRIGEYVIMIDAEEGDD